MTEIKLTIWFQVDCSHKGFVKGNVQAQKLAEFFWQDKSLVYVGCNNGRSSRPRVGGWCSQSETTRSMHFMLYLFLPLFNKLHLKLHYCSLNCTIVHCICYQTLALAQCIYFAFIVHTHLPALAFNELSYTLIHWNKSGWHRFAFLLLLMPVHNAFAVN